MLRILTAVNPKEPLIRSVPLKPCSQQGSRLASVLEKLWRCGFRHVRLMYRKDIRVLID
jgi:hypothetical protein